MPRVEEGIRWFKTQFGNQIENGVHSTPFTVDMITAIAVQETFYLWGALYRTKTLNEVLMLCVGDTFDAPNRSAFPKTKRELTDYKPPTGENMFRIAREALESLAPYFPAYKRVADANPNKFCHGFGIFQYDLQFFEDNPNFFLDKSWGDFDECLKLFIGELKDALRRAYGSNKDSLTENEMVYVAIAYNQGSVNTRGSFKQGHKDENGKYYGEHIRDYLQICKTVT